MGLSCDERWMLLLPWAMLSCDSTDFYDLFCAVGCSVGMVLFCTLDIKFFWYAIQCRINTICGLRVGLSCDRKRALLLPWAVLSCDNINALNCDVVLSHYHRQFASSFEKLVLRIRSGWHICVQLHTDVYMPRHHIRRFTVFALRCYCYLLITGLLRPHTVRRPSTLIPWPYLNDCPRFSMHT